MLSKTVASKVFAAPAAAQRGFAHFDKAPVRIAVTGATGNIAYSVSFRLAA